MNQLVFDKKRLQELKAQISKINPQRIFLVRANKSYFASGADVFINDLVQGYDVESFFEFDPNPQLDDLVKGVAKFKTSSCDLIIAIGGGSVLDMAKLISIFAHQSQSFTDIVTGKEKLNGIKTKLIAIPTTAGSGAEATKFSVLYINKKKYSVEHDNILPDAVYLSSDFSLSAGKYLTACTGLDAFCQAIESVWSVNATEESTMFGLEAIDSVWGNLQKAVNENDVEAREKMQRASFLAGKAINITKTTAPHAMSYAFTSYYGIPHGHAVALSIAFFLKYNYKLNSCDCTDSRGEQAVKSRIDKILDILNVGIDDVEQLLFTFFNSIGINTNISEVIDNLDPKVISENVNFERLKNNPREVTPTVISQLLFNT